MQGNGGGAKVAQVPPMHAQTAQKTNAHEATSKKTTQANQSGAKKMIKKKN